MKKILVLSALFAMFSSFGSANKHIVVNLAQQRACAYEGGRAVFCGHISSGKRGHRTPTGHFRVLAKDIDHRSSKYPKPNGGARMFYMLKLTHSGIAMHLGHTPNYPASHGCIRMQNGFAQRMYRWAPVGTPVTVSYSGRVHGSSRRTYSASANDDIARFLGLASNHRSVKRRPHRRHRRFYRRHRRSGRH